MGRTFRVNLGGNESAPTFYVKFPYKGDDIHEKMMKDIYEQEFLLLTLLNLLGLKTPTEIALIKREGSPIIIKRAAGDSEGRRNEIPTDIDPDYKTRFDVVTKTIGVGDIGGENLIKISDRKEKDLNKMRGVIIDPVLKSDVEEFDIASLVNGESITPLQKVSHYYDKNYNNIKTILDRLDGHFRKSCISALETNDPKLPSIKLGKLIKVIKEKGAECNTPSYNPKPNNSYVARRIAPFLNNENYISNIFQSLINSGYLKEHDDIPKRFSVNIEFYSVKDGLCNEYKKDLDLDFKKAAEKISVNQNELFATKKNSPPTCRIC